MFQALVGLRDTFKHTNMKRSSKAVIAGIQRDQALPHFVDMTLTLGQLW